MSSKKQTATYLRRRFQEIGFQPHSRHGQNFLIDLNLLDLIARAADPGPEDLVLEVGTGTGSLTVRLAERAGQVVTVEIDQRLAQLALEQFEPGLPIQLLQQDALKNKNHLAPEVLQALAEWRSQHPQGHLKLVANLPYSVATPIISNLLLLDDPPSSMTVTIQKEVAERIVASPSTKDYGSLSVWVQSQCFAAILRDLAPSVFWPRPAVDSSIVQIILDPEKRKSLGNLRWFHHFTRQVFMHRRKFLRGSLLSSFPNLEKPTLDELLQRLNIPPDCRAEALSIEQLKILAHGLEKIVESPEE